MEFRKAVVTDANKIMDIIGQAQAYFKECGIDQWQDNYPNPQTIMKDIDNGNSYVLLKDDIIIGTVAIIFDIEKTYEPIYNGNWKSDLEYGVVHRIAIDSRHKGLGFASVILKNVEEICVSKAIRSVRVDTHENNLPMQKLLKKNGFEFCGIIYLEDGSRRMAFEKILV